MSTTEPITAARFQLKLDRAGAQFADFAELQGITSEVNPVDYIASSELEIVWKKLPGQRKPPTITLRRGRDSDGWIWAWKESARSGNISEARRSASLVMYDATGKPVASYHLENAWPMKVDVYGLSESQLLLDVTIACEFMERVPT